ncbi:hypothetical protein AGMMS50233_10860 [Endomicrobiia bacterium]|nr:hypothetical protein AGMMS50233_10860 [Endomicrobiia bacterium]
MKEARQDFKTKNLNLIKKNILNKLKKIPNSKIDYAEVVSFDDLSIADKNIKKVVFAVAIWIGKARLIDNIVMTKRGEK